METINNCPICNSDSHDLYMECKDYTVSGELFSISKCAGCNFLFTNPRPSEEEIGKYYQSEDYVSHSNTSKGLINFLYQIARNFTLKQKFNLVKKVAPGDNVFDYGCGTGAFLNYCKKKGYSTTGFEPDQGAAEEAKNQYALEIIKEQHLNELESHSFDAITLWHVLEHVHRLKELIQNLKRVLKKEGALIIAVPNHQSHDAKKYQASWAAYDVPRHLYHFSPDNIKTLFEEFDMEITNILPMKLDAYYVSMLSEKYRGGNLLSAFLTGMISNLKAKEGTWSSQIYIIRSK